MPSPKVLLILIVLVALAWLALILWRSFQVQRIYSDASTRTPPFTAQHIAAIRKIRFAWNSRVEGGGPVVDPWTPYGSTRIADDLGPIIGTRDPIAVARFHREVSSVLVEMLRTCTLQPGRYNLAHLDNAGLEQRLRRDLDGLPAERIEAVVAMLPRLSADRSFEVTDDHRRLLRSIKFEWPDETISQFVARGGYPAPVVDFKRPFGDMTAYEIDMAAILERPRPPEGATDPTYAKPYWEMWPALHAFVEHAPLALRCGDH